MGFDVDVTLALGENALAVRFAVGDGLTTLFGPSGTGKTSILDAIAGLRTPREGRIAAAGRVLFDAGAGVDIAVELRCCGYVFQEPRLFPHLRVRDNLGYAQPRGRPIATFDEVVALLGIAHLLERWPRRLSGGEARRVAIGRALLSAPAFLLMDEPLASLDPARRDDVMQAIERIRDTLPLPILYVSHDAAEIGRLATRRLDMADITSFRTAYRN